MSINECALKNGFVIADKDTKRLHPLQLIWNCFHRPWCLSKLRKAIGTYLVMHPELMTQHGFKRSLKEVASILQEELVEKQAMHNA